VADFVANFVVDLRLLETEVEATGEWNMRHLGMSLRTIFSLQGFI